MRGPSASAETWIRDAEPRLIARQDGSVVAVSDAFERLAGWPAGSAIGKSLSQLFVSLDPGDFPDFSAIPGGGGFEATVGFGGREGAPPSAGLLKLRAAALTGELFASVLPLPSFAGKDVSVPATSPALPPSHESAQQLRALL